MNMHDAAPCLVGLVGLLRLLFRGLGQVFIYYLTLNKGVDTHGKDPGTYLREINDWVVKFQLRTVLNRLHDSYNMKEHTRTDSQQAAALTPEFIDRFAIVGPPDTCQQRIAELRSLGLDKLVVTGATAGADRVEARKSQQLLEAHLLKG